MYPPVFWTGRFPYRLFCHLSIFLTLAPGVPLRAQSPPELEPFTRSSSLLPRDNREPFFPSAIVHEDSTGFLLQYHNQAGCGTETDCYHYRLVKVSPDLKQDRMLTIDLGNREASSFFTVNQLGEHINVYFRDLNPATGRREYTATTYRAKDFGLVASETPIGSILVSKQGRYSGANFRTNDRTGQLATLLQDKSEVKDRHEPIRVSLFDSLHRQVWQQVLYRVNGREGIRVTDAALRDDGTVVVLVEFSDTNELFLVALRENEVVEYPISLDDTTSLQPWLEHSSVDSTGLYLFGTYYSGPGAEPAGLFVLRMDPANLSVSYASRIALSDENGRPGLRMASEATGKSPAAALRHFNHGRFLPTPDGGGYLVADQYAAGRKSTAAQSFVEEHYGTITVLRLDASGNCRWVRNLYRDISSRQGLSIHERFGVHTLDNDLLVVFNHDRRGDLLTGKDLRSLDFLPNMESVAVRLGPDNLARVRKLLPFEAEKTILVPPVTSLSADGSVLHAAIQKPMGDRKMYAFKLDW